MRWLEQERAEWVIGQFGYVLHDCHYDIASERCTFLTPKMINGRCSKHLWCWCVAGLLKRVGSLTTRVKIQIPCHSTTVMHLIFFCFTLAVSIFPLFVGVLGCLLICLLGCWGVCLLAHWHKCHDWDSTFHSSEQKTLNFSPVLLIPRPRIRRPKFSREHMKWT